jgi:3-hydroxybutyryl-CoA dehydrogenase
MEVAVIGCGTMGSGIAQIAATNNCTTYLYDINDEALEKSKEKLIKILNRLIEKERIDTDEKNRILNNITYTSKLESIKEADLVIEAIIENLEIKKKLFKEVEDIVSEDCIIASNTSSLSITSLAAALEKPERFIGLHFFNPAPLMKLVEIIPALQTSQEVLNKSKSIIDDWGKVTVIAKDTPGFIVNKVARPFYSESIKYHEETGAAPDLLDMAIKSLGFRMGPFELTDYIGHDVNYVVTETVWKAFYYDPRYTPSFTQKRLVEAGYLGRKSNRGFYKYPRPEYTEQAIPDFKKLKSFQNRVLMILINEAADTLFKGIATKKDIDLAMTKGVNYPKGLFAWADEIGIQECVNHIDALYDEFHSDRYRCCPLLRKMAKENKTFYS